MQTQASQSLFTALTSDEAAKTQGGHHYYYPCASYYYRPVSYYYYPRSYAAYTAPSVSQNVNVLIDD